MDVTRQGIEDQRTRYYTRCSLLKESGQVRQVFDLASFLWCTVGSDGTAVGIDQSKTCLRPDRSRKTCRSALSNSSRFLVVRRKTQNLEDWHTGSKYWLLIA